MIEYNENLIGILKKNVERCNLDSFYKKEVLDLISYHESCGATGLYMVYNGVRRFYIKSDSLSNAWARAKELSSLYEIDQVRKCHLVEDALGELCVYHNNDGIPSYWDDEVLVAEPYTVGKAFGNRWRRYRVHVC